jgi:hypothetical protein
MNGYEDIDDANMALATCLAALTRIANEPCDHGPMSFCPREEARTALKQATRASLQDHSKFPGTKQEQ